MHAYVDESERGGYLVAAALVERDDLDDVRRVLRDLRKPGQRRVHFTKESDSRRRLILDRLGRLPIRLRLYESGGDTVPARARCLSALVDDLVVLGAERLVLERLDSRVRADVATIRARLSGCGGAEPALV